MADAAVNVTVHRSAKNVFMSENVAAGSPVTSPIQPRTRALTLQSGRVFSRLARASAHFGIGDALWMICLFLIFRTVSVLFLVLLIISTLSMR